MKTHPVAELFPMMSEEELNDLAEDIKTNGLQFPIVLDSEGQLCDGRNRAKACKIAGVKPETRQLNGDIDPVAFIMSANEHRRHMTKGQRAAVAAKARLFLKNSQTKTAASIGTSQSQIAYANVVLEYAPPLLDAVISGTLALNEAYEKAQKAKSDATVLQSLSKT